MLQPKIGPKVWEEDRESDDGMVESYSVFKDNQISVIWKKRFSERQVSFAPNLTQTASDGLAVGVTLGYKVKLFSVLNIRFSFKNG